MGHHPHLYLPPPWTGDAIAISSNQTHHLSRVLRHTDGEVVSYTDGQGTLGRGHLVGEAVKRGSESRQDPPRVSLTLAVATPREKDRARFLVEKAAELEVRRLVWLTTAYGQTHPPPKPRAVSWAVAGLEQSRSAFLMSVAEEPLTLKSLPAVDPTLWVADQTGGPLPLPAPAEVTLAIGPEGGWSAEELEVSPVIVSLGRSILRVETAALVGAGLVINF